MMKKLLVLAVLLAGFFCSSQGFAREIGEDKNIDITVTQSYVSRYIYKAQDAFEDNDGAYQASVDAAFPGLIWNADISLNVWGSFALDSGHEEFDEIDYSVTVSKDIFEDWNVTGSYFYFDYPNADSLIEANELQGSLTWKKFPYLPIDTRMILSVIYDFPAVSGGPENGWYYSWGWETDFPLPETAAFRKDQALTLGVVNWGTDGVGGRKPSKLYATVLSLSTDYVFGKMAISPNFNYAFNYENEINDGNDEVWYEINVSWRF